jgi:hypothetical protein
MEKQLTTQIAQYRNSKGAGKIKVLAHTDVYGNITAAVEQTVHDMLTGAERVHVLAPVTKKDIDTVIEKLNALLIDGDPNNPNESGIKRLEEQIVQFQKMVADTQEKIDQRKKQFGEEIANMEAMRDDIAAVIAEKEQERKTALEKPSEKPSEEVKTAKKTNA